MKGTQTVATGLGVNASRFEEESEVELRSTGATLVNATVSLDQLTQIHQVLAGPCRSQCSVLDAVADSLEALGGLMSWRDPHLSRHVACTLVALAAALSLLLRLAMTPLWSALDVFAGLS